MTEQRPAYAEQPLPTPGAVSVTDALMELLEQRKAKGIATYGTSLFSFNGRDSTQDLVEELVDAAQYALQWQIERRELLAERDRLRNQQAELIRFLGQIAQQVHQAYHQDCDGTWRECPRGVCANVQAALREFGKPEATP